MDCEKLKLKFKGTAGPTGSLGPTGQVGPTGSLGPTGSPNPGTPINGTAVVDPVYGTPNGKLNSLSSPFDTYYNANLAINQSGAPLGTRWTILMNPGIYDYTQVALVLAGNYDLIGVDRENTVIYGQIQVIGMDQTPGSTSTISNLTINWSSSATGQGAIWVQNNQGTIYINNVTIIANISTNPNITTTNGALYISSNGVQVNNSNITLNLTVNPGDKYINTSFYYIEDLGTFPTNVRISNSVHNFNVTGIPRNNTSDGNPNDQDLLSSIYYTPTNNSSSVISQSNVYNVTLPASDVNFIGYNANLSAGTFNGQSDIFNFNVPVAAPTNSIISVPPQKRVPVRRHVILAHKRRYVPVTLANTPTLSMNLHNITNTGINENSYYGTLQLAINQNSNKAIAQKVSWLGRTTIPQNIQTSGDGIVPTDQLYAEPNQAVTTGTTSDNQVTVFTSNNTFLDSNSTTNITIGPETITAKITSSTDVTITLPAIIDQNIGTAPSITNPSTTSTPSLHNILFDTAANSIITITTPDNTPFSLYPGQKATGDTSVKFTRGVLNYNNIPNLQTGVDRVVLTLLSDNTGTAYWLITKNYVREQVENTVVPTGATQLGFSIWGPGGQGSPVVNNEGGAGGGSGGFLQAVISVTPGDKVEMGLGKNGNYIKTTGSYVLAPAGGDAVANNGGAGGAAPTINGGAFGGLAGAAGGNSGQNGSNLPNYQGGVGSGIPVDSNTGIGGGGGGGAGYNGNGPDGATSTTIAQVAALHSGAGGSGGYNTGSVIYSPGAPDKGWIQYSWIF